MLSAPTIDLLAVPFSSCFTGGRYDGERLLSSFLLQQCLAANAPKAISSSSSASSQKASGGSQKKGDEARKNKSLSADETVQEKDHRPQTTAGGGGGEEREREKEDQLNPYDWWAPPIGAGEDFPSSSSTVDGLSDRLGRTMELLVQSLSSLSSPRVVSLLSFFPSRFLSLSLSVCFFSVFAERQCFFSLGRFSRK